jgi:MoaA/NifB/PqqE/SkfB family radical SAM enzyme
MNCSFCSRREFLERKDRLSTSDRLEKFKDIFGHHLYTVISFTGGEPLQDLEFLFPL